MEWMWNSVSSGWTTVKKKSNAMKDWIWSNKVKTLGYVAVTATLIYFIISLISSRKKLAPRRKGTSEEEEAKAFIENMDAEISSVQFKNKMRFYFEKAQEGSNVTLNAFVIKLRDNLESSLKIPNTNHLRNSMKASNEEKMAIWNEVKGKTFTKAICSVYGVSMLFVFMRTAVNILGRYLYMDSISNGTTDKESPLSEEAQRKYLSFADYFVDKQLEEFINYIQYFVEEELKAWPLTKNCTFEDLMTILTNIRVRIEEPEPQDSTNKRQKPLYSFLLPPEGIHYNNDKQLEQLLNETRDILEGDQFQRALMSSLNRSYNVLANVVRDSFLTSLAPPNPNSKVPPGTMPIAKIIPLLGSCTGKIMEQPESKTSVLPALYQLSDIEVYSRYIFTNSSEDE